MNNELLATIRQCANLPSLPTVAIKVLELAQRDEVDIAEIARIISRDPALSSKILRTVNSSFYGRGQAISTISHALVILGIQSVKTLVLGFSLVTNLSKNQSKGFKHIAYWKRSIFAAAAARLIAKRTNVVQQEECFLAALMMDIGMLVLDQVLGNRYDALCAPCRTHNEIFAAENDQLGGTHAVVGGFLAETWKLPPLLSIPIKNHHEPQYVQDAGLRRLTEVVCLAGRCADVFVEEEPAAAITDVRRICLDTYKMSPADCDKMLEEICASTQEVSPLFDINIGPSTSYDAILRKASEALVDLTLRSQQQLSTLSVQNEQLHRKATTDGLTSLSNRATFDEYMATQFADATRSGEPMSMLMLDIDKFKSINDTHGHQTGDAVLQHVAKVFKAAARPQDLAARYGGEELTLVLPGTPRMTAATIADTLCRALAARPVQHGSKVLRITVSIGVATYEPGGLMREAIHLIKAADMAVYAAKRAGRNCVRVFSMPVRSAA